MTNDVPCIVTTKDGKQVIKLVYGVKTIKPEAYTIITCGEPKESKFKLGITFKIFGYKINI